MKKHESGIITIVCQEFSKVSDELSEIYVVKRDVSDCDLFAIRLRGMYNPELHYYATCLHGTDEELIAVAKKSQFKEPYFTRL